MKLLSILALVLATTGAVKVNHLNYDYGQPVFENLPGPAQKAAAAHKAAYEAWKGAAVTPEERLNNAA